nr:hypothetical protein [uncultured Allomuricauda sp.]
MIHYDQYRPTRYILVLLLFLGCGQLLSQTTDANALLGSWQFDSASSFAQRAEATKAVVEAHPEIQSKIMASYVGKSISFFENGDYQQQLGDGSNASGRWSTDGGSLLISTSDGSVYRFSFGINGDQLLLQTISDDPGYKSLVPNQYFTKIQ